MSILPLEAERYLDALSQRLAPADPADRLEIITGIREHIAARLAEGGSTPADVQRVLTELGSPDAVADQALPTTAPAQAATPAPPVPPTPPTPRATQPSQPTAPTPEPVMARFWVVPTVAILLGLTLLQTTLIALRGIPETPIVMDGALGPLLPAVSGFDMVVVLALTSPIWLVGVILLWASRRWGAGWKVLATLVPWWPPLLGVPGFDSSNPALAWGGVLAGIVIGVGSLILTTRAGARGRPLGERPRAQ